MIDCTKVLQQLLEYIDHELDSETALHIEEHMKMCRACFDHHEFEKLLREHIRQKTYHPCPHQLKKKITDLLQRF